MTRFQQVQQLRQRKAELVRSAGEVLQKATGDKRSMNASEEAKFKELHTEVESLNVTITALEQQHQAEESVATLPATESRNGDRDATVEAELRNRALALWLGGNPAQLQAEPVEVREAFQRHGFNMSDGGYGRLPGAGGKPAEGSRDGYMLLTGRELRRAWRMLSLANLGTMQEVERRAPLSTSLTTGGDLIPQGFVARIEAALKEYGGMREVAEILRTDSGNELPWPTDDDTGNVGELLAESTAAAEQNITTGRLVLNAFKYSSKLVLIPRELLEDSAFDVEAWVAEKLGVRLGRITNLHFTTGDGTNKPQGVVTASAQGATAASATVVTRGELLTLKHSVDPAYRRQGGRYMFNDTTLLELKQLVDGQSRPLWQAGLADGQPDRIDGDPYTVNQDMPNTATGQKAILYGAFRYYKIREVRGMRLVRMLERYAEKDQVGMLAFERVDGDLINTAAVKHLVMA